MGKNSDVYESCFLHFFDTHFLENKKREHKINKIQKEILLATKIAFFCCSSLTVPMASYCENEQCKKIIDSIIKVVPDYNIFLTAAAESPIEFAYSKLSQYSTSSPQYSIYCKICDYGINKGLKLKPKRYSSTGYIKDKWNLWAENGKINAFFAGVARILSPNFDDNCRNLHMLLDGKAYIPEYVNNALFFDINPNPALYLKVDRIVNTFYFESYLNEYKNLAVITELNLLRSSYVDEEAYPIHIPYDTIIRKLKDAERLKEFDKISFKSLNKFKQSEDTLKGIVCGAIEEYYEKKKIFSDTYKKMELIASSKGGKENMSQININVGNSGNTNIGVQNSGDVCLNQTAADWNKLTEDINKITSQKTLEPSVVDHLKDAVQRKDINLLKSVLEAAKMTKDFMLSVGASYLANHLPLL